MKCFNHVDREIDSICSICGRGVCGECKINLVGRFYCQKCADDLVKEGAVIALKKLYEILEEKRKHHRVYTLIPAEIYLVGQKGTFLKGILHNVSSAGVAILCDEEISLNDIVVLNFKLPNGVTLEDVQGGVVRVEKIWGKCNLGVLFMNLLEKQQIINDFMLDFKKKKYTNGSIDMTNYVL
ncbi:MAG: PilZ domain-containing protein [Candidatus Firestonebacteria bacterium]